MAKRLTNQGYQYKGMPHYVPLSQYTQAKKTIARLYAKTGQVVAIYDWGNPSVPGISDLDLLFVIKDNAKALPLLRRTFRTLPKSLRYIVVHSFVFISEQDAKHVPYFYPDGTMKKVWGKELKFVKLSEKEKKLVRISLLNDLIIRHYPRDFLKQLDNEHVNIRASLLRLNSLRYTFDGLQKLGKKNTNWTKLSKEIKFLRENWFKKPQPEKVVELLQRAEEYMEDVLEGFHSILSKQLSQKTKGEKAFSGIKNKTVFSEKWKKEDVGYYENDYTKLPADFSAQLVFYALHQGPLSAYLRSHFAGSLDICLKKDLKAVAEKRITLLNNQVFLTNKLKHSDFPAFIDFGYRSTEGINNVLLQLLDRIRF